jgi:site-specific recombinase XerD
MMKKKQSDRILPYLRDFFTVYLPKQRNCSPHTITACRQAWNMLLKHICASSNKRLEDLVFADLGRAAVTGFLDEMEKAKDWIPSTRNHRLGCIRSFFKFAASLEPVLAIYLEDLKGIPLKKSADTSRVMEFMSQEAMGAVLRQPDISTKMGIRDVFFMALMYDAAARDCEMLSMRFCDIDPEKRTVYLFGKGSKSRLVPVSEETVRHFRRYEKAFHPSSDGTTPMFYTIHRNEKTFMSDDNVARFMQKYGAGAKKQFPDIPEKVTPHMFRRSRAMHLYRSGMPLELLAELLGHANPETVWVYAYADTEMKRKAIMRAEANAGLQPSAEIGIWDGDEDMIRRLCGLA